MEHQSFVDWMKALGMLLIVTGHIYGDPYHIFNSVSLPVYTKQLGVAFFVFITGWSLANDARPGRKVVFNRIFPIYFYGITSALFLSAIFFVNGMDINESNYLPFFGGINVFFNYFPANPTTWYIGTYLHLVLFWFFFIRGREIRKRHLVAAFLVENILRSLVIAMDQNTVAYMMLPNWLTIFLLGGYLHKKRDAGWNPKVLLLVIAWGVVLAFWSSSFNSLPFEKAFPFLELSFGNYWETPFQSLLISIIYIANTLVIMEIVRYLPRLRIVSFFARNTLIIFIMHMPIIHAFSIYIYELLDVISLRRLIWVFILYVGIAIASEIIQKFINMKLLCNKSWGILQKMMPRLLSEPTKKI